MLFSDIFFTDSYVMYVMNNFIHSIFQTLQVIHFFCLFNNAYYKVHCLIFSWIMNQWKTINISARIYRITVSYPWWQCMVVSYLSLGLLQADQCHLFYLISLLEYGFFSIRVSFFTLDMSFFLLATCLALKFCVIQRNRWWDRISKLNEIYL